MALLKATPKATANVAKKAPAKKSATKTVTKAEIGKLAKEYSEISSQIKVLEERKKVLASLIKEGSIKYGTLDDKGSSYFEVNGFVAGNVSKVSMSLDQTKGVEFLERMGLGDLVDETVVKTINEDRLEKAVGEKRLTLDDVESFTNRKTTYQVSVKSVKDMPEVEQSNMSLAASRK